MTCTKYNTEKKVYEPYEPTTIEEEKELLNAELKAHKAVITSAFWADYLTNAERERVAYSENKIKEIEKRLAEMEERK